MTTIAYKDGVLAADTLVTCGHLDDGIMIKIAKRGSALACVSGGAAGSQRFLDWFRSGLKGDCPDMGPSGETSATGVLFYQDRVVIFTPSGGVTRRVPYFTDGSGWELAKGALAMGASAEEAVRVAAMFDIHTGGEITVFRAA